MTSFVDHTFNILSYNSRRDNEPEYVEYRRKWYDNPTNKIVGDYPLHVDIETTTICNLECVFCFQSFDKPEPMLMTDEIMDKILEEIDYDVCSVKLQYRGEPLTDKRIPEIISDMWGSGYQEVMFNTNANLLTQDMSKQLVEAGLDKLICSVEGSTPEQYNESRINGDFDTVVKNIQYLQAYKKSVGSDTPIVRVQMVKTPDNAHTIGEYHDFWKNIADIVAVEDMLDFEATEKDETELPNWWCPQLYQRLMVLADGDIVPCCKSLIGGTGKQIVLGNIDDMSIHDAWHGATLTRLRDMHKAGRSHEIEMCARCGIRKDVVSNDMS